MGRMKDLAIEQMYILDKKLLEVVRLDKEVQPTMTMYDIALALYSNDMLREYHALCHYIKESNHA